MRALLRPVIARELGVVLLKPGSELMSLFSCERVLVESQPANMATLATGRVPDARQPLLEDEFLMPFFLDKSVIAAAGGLNGLDYWLLRYGGGVCQYQHSNYHYHELTTMRYEPGSVLLCCYCDNQLRDHSAEDLERIAKLNVARWILDTVRIALKSGNEREISLAELCWWAVLSGITSAIPESVACAALGNRPEEFSSVMRESDITPSLSATHILANRVREFNSRNDQQVVDSPVVRMAVDPEPPASFFARPKRYRWQNDDYISWVKMQPCSCCGNRGGDAHHLIGHGQGGMGTKAHDSFTIPLCRKHHRELHNDPVKFEQKYGSQLEMLKSVLDLAFALGVLA
ncbi:DUF968 domain-containing protein [Salmonella enterica]|nr:DUF968 domain-containing protein [Salmonella enterica]